MCGKCIEKNVLESVRKTDIKKLLLFKLPDSATIEISTPCSKAMKPKTEKMAKPATKLVPLFSRHR